MNKLLLAQKMLSLAKSLIEASPDRDALVQQAVDLLLEGKPVKKGSLTPDELDEVKDALEYWTKPSKQFDDEDLPVDKEKSRKAKRGLELLKLAK